MPTNVLLRHLKYFIKPHPEFGLGEDKIFVPNPGLTIRFWFEGNLQVGGDENSLMINLNEPQLLVLAVTEGGKDRIFRVPWARMVSLELCREVGTGQERLAKIFTN
jgi:hypothetical protein